MRDKNEESFEEYKDENRKLFLQGLITPEDIWLHQQAKIDELKKENEQLKRINNLLEKSRGGIESVVNGYLKIHESGGIASMSDNEHEYQMALAEKAELELETAKQIEKIRSE